MHREGGQPAHITTCQIPTLRTLPVFQVAGNAVHTVAGSPAPTLDELLLQRQAAFRSTIEAFLDAFATSRDRPVSSL